MLQATITVQFGINCTATSSNLGLIALLRVVIITHYNPCYVINMDNQFLIFKVQWLLTPTDSVNKGHQELLTLPDHVNLCRRAWFVSL